MIPTPLIVLLLLLALLILLGLTRIGGDAEYSDRGLNIRLRLGAFHFKVYPRSGKNRKKKKKGDTEQKTPSDSKEPKKKQGGGLVPLRRLLTLGCQAAGELKHQIRIDRLDLTVTFGGANAAAAALAFGGSHAILGMLWPLLDQNFEVKERNLRTSVDFDAPAPSVYAFAAFSGRLFRLLQFALRYTIQLIRMTRSEAASKTAGSDKKEAI